MTGNLLAAVAMVALYDVRLGDKTFGPGRPDGVAFFTTEHQAGRLVDLGAAERDSAASAAAAKKAEDDAAAVKKAEDDAAAAKKAEDDAAAAKKAEDAAAAAKKPAARAKR